MALPRLLSAAGMSVFIVLAASQSPTLAQQPPEFTIQHRGWEGGAFANEEGQFSHCAVERTFENGVRMIVRTDTALQTNLAFVNDDWTFEPDQRLVVQLSVDEDFRQQFPGVPVSEQVLVIPVGQNAELYRYLREGIELSVETPDETLTFPLTGTSVSLGTLRQCVQTATRLIESDPELSAAPPSSLTADSGLSLRALAEILNRAGLEDLAFMRPEEVPENALNLRHVWRVGEDMVGGLHQQPRGEEIRIDAFAQNYAARFEDLCPAEAEMDMGETTVIREIYALKSATVRCGQGEEADFVSLFFALDDLNYSVFFHQTRAANQQAALDATEGVRRVVRNLAESSADGSGDGATEAEPGGEAAPAGVDAGADAAPADGGTQ